MTTKPDTDPLDAMAEQAGAPVEGQSAPLDDVSTTPAISNAQILAGAIAAGRDAFCAFTKLQSPRTILTDDRVQTVGDLWGPVCDKHGWNLGKYLGDYAVEFTAIVGTIGIVAEIRAAVRAELAALKAEQEKPADGEPQQ